ncbi:membrane-binding protein [Pontibacter sp. SGAir0037]|uniref:membrane-binding protein n=1 Tax=Pontibacter sp. SGAir0037 TaxID=2571030 RepID=UPI0010CD228A|nr:membrane-binding protein [Pontibacter sp. SGAir0037]QCR22964.1 membrane-binding protein [Pontibacter sp. SGAir0037]
MKKLAFMVALVVAPLLASALPVATTADAYEAIRPAPRDIIDEIIEVVGLKPRFELRAANIENAAAVVYNGKRYILYNEQFLNSINNAVRTDWAGVSILAHEIGHHLNGHTLSRTGSNPADELEADEFSGFVLRKMGASLEDAQAAIKLLSEERTSSTHPGRSYRLAAISKGWSSADEQIVASAGQTGNALRPSQVASRAAKPEVSEPVAVQTQRTDSRQVLDSKYILRKVNFSAAPNEQFFLTTRMHLVHVTKDGLKVIGKLARTNSREVPFYFESDYLNALFITDKGVLINKNGQRVGYLS